MSVHSLTNESTRPKMGAGSTIAVIVATCDRPELLASRSIPSILAQIKQPDILIIIDDSRSLKNKVKNAAYVQSIRSESTVISLVSNQRTPGASGAWNTGIDLIFRQVELPEDTYVAILDDDDAWRPSYLAKCIERASSGNYDLVAADLSRIEDVNGPPLEDPGPSMLNAEDFLVGNPGLQASNLFLRLSTMLMAGCFDESIRSSTDRDLCIRLSDLSTIRFTRLPEVLVDHYAEPGRARLTSSGSEAKLSGLDTFWNKYGGRMTPLQRSAFTQRAISAFHWVLPSSENRFSAQPRKHEMMQPNMPSTGFEKMIDAPVLTPFHIVIGVISSEPATLWPLLHSIAEFDAASKVLILDNGCPQGQLESIVVRAKSLGLHVVIFTFESQKEDAKKGLFGTEFIHRPTGQVGIAQARTMIQRYIGQEISNNQHTFGWILDDDMRLDERCKKYLSWLPALRADGVDVVLGSYEGSSPNPPINGLRVQLVDLIHNLRWLDGLASDQILPNRSDENLRSRTEHPDYYYDLSRKHTGHLEQPHWIEPSYPNESVGEARSRLLRDAPLLLEGAPLTRPLKSVMPSNPVKEARTSVNRGGVTFVLNPEAVNSTPNMIVQIQGKEARRSDMLWAIVNHYYRKLVIKSISFPVLHEARKTSSKGLNFHKVQAEIVGSSMYAGLTTFLQNHSNHSLEFSEKELNQLESEWEVHLNDRLVRLRKSFYRIRGLHDSLLATPAAGELAVLLHQLDQWFTEENWQKIFEGATSLKASELRTFLTSLRGIADDYSERTPQTKE